MEVTTVNVLVGAGSALAGAIISGITQYLLIEKKAKKDRELSDYYNFRAIVENTHTKLGKLSLMLSISKADMAHGEEKLKYFNENYDKANELMSEIIMACTLYFPSVKSNISPIQGEANRYWGYFKAVLMSNGEKTADYIQGNSRKSAEASINCLAIIEEVKGYIEEIAKAKFS